MRDQVQEFHRKNPVVWGLFEKFTLEVINRGFQHYSVNAIFERIRWEQDVAGDKEADRFKLNNNHRPFYSRRFMTCYPQHDGFFRTRTQTSGGKRATNLPELTPSHFDDGARL
tara:strand:+ start:496 stop:834 length:339 start_codon:yes stop_codon:yes gene_type:complete